DERGRVRPQRARILGLRKGRVKLRQRLNRPRDRLGVLANEQAQLAQNALDLRLLRNLKLADAVVDLDRRLRLDEHRRTRSGLVVHDALDAPLCLRSQRDHVAPAALRDDGLLQVGRIAAALDDALQATVQPVMLDAQLVPDGRQRRAGGGQHLALLADRAVDGGHQRLALAQRPGDLREQGEALGDLLDGGLQRAARLQRRLDLKEVLRQQRDLAGRPPDVPAYVPRPADRHLAVLLEQQARLARLLLAAARLVQPVSRLKLLQKLAAGREGSILREAGKHLIQFKLV